MRYWAFALVGLAVTGAGLALAGWGITSAFDTANCVTTGTIQKIEHCADDTGTHVLAIVAGTLATPVGVLVWAMRGGDGRRSAISLTWVVYSLTFLIVGAGMLWVAFGPDASGNDTIRLVGGILGATFIPIGVMPIVLIPIRRHMRARTLERRASWQRTTASVQQIAATGVRVNGNPRLRFALEVRPPIGAPYTVEKSAVVPPFAVPRIGDELVVYCDPEQPTNVDIAWEEQPSAPVPVPSAFG